MREWEAAKVDAFTTTPFAGNAAGVVPDAEGLGEAQMRGIAREMNVSETAFVLPPERGGDMRLRFLTPTSEVTLCGHATVATFHRLVETGRLLAPCTLRVETGAGTLPVEVREDGRVFLTSDAITYAPSPVTPDEIARLLGLPREDVLGGAMIIKGNLVAPVSGLKAMAAMYPDIAAIKMTSARCGFQGIAPLCLETHDARATTHTRYFAPHVGIDEDPVTGTIHMGLAGYLLKLGRIAPGEAFLGEQGHECGRPGIVEVETEQRGTELVVRIGGRAVTTFAGHLQMGSR